MNQRSFTFPGKVGVVSGEASLDFEMTDIKMRRRDIIAICALMRDGRSPSLSLSLSLSPSSTLLWMRTHGGVTNFLPRCSIVVSLTLVRNEHTQTQNLTS